MKLAVQCALVIGLLLPLLSAQAGPPKRVVVAGGGVTELVYALGAEKVLVGVDTSSQYPTAALKLPKVGYLRALSTEGLLSLTPDAVLVTDEAGPAKTLEVLEQAGVDIQRLNSDYSVAGLLSRLEQMAVLLDKPIQAKILRQQIEQQQRELRILLRGRSGDPVRILFLLTHGGRSPMSAGKGTAADALIRMAGAVNVVDSFHGYRPLSQEAIAALRPDYILTTQQGLQQIGGAQSLLNRAGINLTPAAQKQQLIAMDALYLLGFGPRVVEAARELAEQLYPSVVAAQ